MVFYNYKFINSIFKFLSKKKTELIYLYYLLSHLLFLVWCYNDSIDYNIHKINGFRKLLFLNIKYNITSTIKYLLLTFPEYNSMPIIITIAQLRVYCISYDIFFYSGVPIVLYKYIFLYDH